jgi:hypothetical protein
LLFELVAVVKIGCSVVKGGCLVLTDILITVVNVFLVVLVLLSCVFVVVFFFLSGVKERVLLIVKFLRLVFFSL